MPLTRFEWESIEDAFEDHNCILMLGKSLAKITYEGQKMSLEEAFASYLVTVLEQEKMPYEKSQQKNLTYIAHKFLKIKTATDPDLWRQIKKVYNRNAQIIPAIYYELAQLPFQLIINTSPDDFMVRAMREVGKNYTQFDWYNFRRGKKFEITEINVDKPLVYNLFGSVRKPESLVLTEKDQLDFLKSVVKKEPRVPDKIVSLFNEHSTYLFYEFNLEHWHFRPLLDAMNLHKSIRTITPKFSKLQFNALTKEFYQEQFKFRFIDDDCHVFTSSLKEKVNMPVSIAKPGEIHHTYIAAVNNDIPFRNKLEEALANQNGLKIWHRGKIKDGYVHRQIDANMKKASVILVILSIEYFSEEDYFERGAIQKLIEANTDKRIIPIIAKACDWKNSIFQNSPVKYPNQIDVEPHHLPISQWDDQAAAYTHIVQQLEKLLF